MSKAFTRHQAAQELHTTLEEVTRAMIALKLFPGREHVDERQLFQLKKWLRDNPAPGRSVADAAAEWELDPGLVSKAVEAITHRHQLFVPTDVEIQVRNWAKKHKQWWETEGPGSRRG